jgi:hypothetical protein
MAHFFEDYQARYLHAGDCLAKERDALMRHLRTTNPMDSTFATIRLRHRRTKGSGRRSASLTMTFKLAESAARRWGRLNGHELLPDVIRGVLFQDGLRRDQAVA